MILLDDNRFSLVVANALDFLRSLPDKSVDMILTDPPYSPHVHEKLGKEKRNDGVKPREELKFPPMTPELITLYSEQYVRVCKGWIISFTDFYNTHRWGLSIANAGGAWVRTGQWVKTNPMPQLTGDRPACGTEDILIGHASADSGPWEWNGKGHAATWRGPRDTQGLHPNQKPLWLVQQLLGMFAPAGALVLDCFLGSGTTAIAAVTKERVLGDSCYETACKKCAAKRAEEYAPPLPIDLRVIGVEGDLETANKAKERYKQHAVGVLEGAG